MKRRSFFKKLGISGLVASVAPQIIQEVKAEEPEPFEIGEDVKVDYKIIPEKTTRKIDVLFTTLQGEVIETEAYDCKIHTNGFGSYHESTCSMETPLFDQKSGVFQAFINHERLWMTIYRDSRELCTWKVLLSSLIVLPDSTMELELCRCDYTPTFMGRIDGRDLIKG